MILARLSWAASRKVGLIARKPLRGLLDLPEGESRGEGAVANRVTVQHIFPSGELHPHQPTPGAKIDAKQVIYPASEKSLFE